MDSRFVFVHFEGDGWKQAVVIPRDGLTNAEWNAEIYPLDAEELIVQLDGFDPWSRQQPQKTSLTVAMEAVNLVIVKDHYPEWDKDEEDSTAVQD